MKCLIVDDEELGRELIRCFLAEYADVIDMAADGAEAVGLFENALMAKAPYDFICLDILMPVMDGQEALKKMRRMEMEAGLTGGREAVIVMTTALNSLQDIQEALWRGDCNNYLVKLVLKDDLVSLLRKYHLIPAE